MNKKINGGEADNMSVKDIAKKFDVSVDSITHQLKMGIEVEKEHTNDAALARDIAMDHLSEMPDYYTQLDKMENKSKEKWKKKIKESIRHYINKKAKG